MRRFGRWVGGLLGLCLIALVLGALIPGARSQIDPGAPQTDILLIAGPIHYDILLPLDAATLARFEWMQAQGIAIDHVGAEWLVIGWGAREFYTATGGYRDIRPEAIWQGLTGDSAVLRVSLAGPISNDVNQRKLTLSAPGYTALLNTIEASLADGKSTTALALPGFTDFDRFFPAKGRFHLFKTCNVWIGQALRASGLRFGAWTPLPFSVSLSHRIYHAPH